MAEHYFFHDNDFVSTPNINNILLTLQDNSIVINFMNLKPEMIDMLQEKDELYFCVFKQDNTTEVQ